MRLCTMCYKCYIFCSALLNANDKLVAYEGYKILENISRDNHKTKKWGEGVMIVVNSAASKEGGKLKHPAKSVCWADEAELLMGNNCFIVRLLCPSQHD